MWNQRTRIGAGTLFALFVFWGWLTSRSPTKAQIAAEERAAEEARQQARAAVQAAADEQGRRNEEQRKAFEASRDPAVRKVMLEKLWSSAATLDAAKRESLLRERCTSAGGCEVDVRDVIIATASDDAERNKLKALAKKLDAEIAAAAKREAAESAKAEMYIRERFADSIDTALLNKHRNPDGVYAEGPEKRTLRIKGWFCSRQFMHDFTAASDNGEAARQLGFKRLVCENALETWSQDL
jgi:hypothetical protein